MKKILVVDDEAIQRRVLGKMIREAMPDCEVIEATNGKAALEIVCSDYVDLVITDIKMPIMDGFDFIEQMNASATDTKIIILSGYRYFEYAQRAIRLGAYDYLLKPVKEENIALLLRKVKDSIHKEKMQSLENETIKKQLDNSRSVYYEHLLQEWLTTGISEHRFEELHQNFSLEDSGMVIVTQFPEAGIADVTGELHAKLKCSMTSLMNDRLCSVGPTVSFFSTEDGRLMITILTAEMPTRIKARHVTALLREVGQEMFERHAMLVNTGIGGLRGNLLWEAKDSLKEALTALSFRYFLSAQRVFPYCDIAGLIRPMTYDFLKDEELLKEYIRTMKSEILIKYTNEMFDRTVDSGYPEPKQWVRTFIHMLYHIAPVIKDFVSDEDYQRILREMEILLHESSSFSAFKQQFADNIQRFMTIIQDSRSKKHESTVDKCMAYLEKHYMEDLSLDTVAKQLYFSPNYLSMIFKQHLGTSFSKYLSQLRIKKAVELLESHDMKVYEVASKVGYKDEKYFHRVFKNNFGLTPDEYRKNHAAGTYLR